MLKKKTFTMSYIQQKAVKNNNTSDFDIKTSSSRHTKRINKGSKFSKSSKNALKNTRNSHQICRFIDPVSIHRLPGDILIVDKYDYEDNIPHFYNYNHFKTIRQFYIDKALNSYTYELYDNDFYYSNPQLVISRLNSLGDSDAHELAELVNQYCQKNKEKIFEQNSDTQYQVFDLTNSQIINNNKDFPYLTIKFVSVGNDSELQLKSIGFNQKFLEIIFGSKDSIEKKMRSDIIPNFIIIKKKNYFNFIKSVLKTNIMDEKVQKMIITLFLNEEFDVDFSAECYKNSFKNDSYFEIFKLVKIELTDSKMLEISEKRKNFESFEKKEKKDKIFCEEWTDLINRYYKNHNKKKNDDPNEENKRCKYKAI